MKKLILFFVLILPFSVSTVLTFRGTARAAHDNDKLSGSEIVSKYLTALGDEAARAAIKSRVAIGTARKDNDASAPMAIMSEAPNRVSAIYQFEGFNWQLTFDGTKAIVRPVLSRANAPVMRKYEDMLGSGTMFNDISLNNVLAQRESGNINFDVKGIRKVRGRATYTVEMKRGKDKALLYFDAENFMWVRTDYGSVRITRELGAFTNAVESKDQENTYDFYVETSDFKQVDGLRLPFKVEIVATAPILKQKNIGTIVATIGEYRHNVAIDPKMFQ